MVVMLEVNVNVARYEAHEKTALRRNNSDGTGLCLCPCLHKIKINLDIGG